ncbi:MAG: ribose-phosphate pyrophosphokinase [Nanoarchaeota archaeon]|nr:ribose-phosphate pyrophosphokinase [Nanoarchaeota archaeon]
MANDYLEDKVFCSIKEFDGFGHVVSELCGQYEDIDHVIHLEEFSGGEFCPKFQVPIKDKTVYLFATPDHKVNTQEMISRIWLVSDAAMENGAKDIVLIAPELPYSRQDRGPKEDKKFKGRPFSAKALAKNFHLWGIKKVLTHHMHTKRIYNIYGQVYGKDKLGEYSKREGITPDKIIDKEDQIGRRIIYNLNPNPLLAHYLRFNSSLVKDYGLDITGKDIVFISPDAGAKFNISNLQNYCFLPESSYCNCLKIRESPNNPDDVTVELDEFSDNFSGLENKTIIIADDIVDTGGTLKNTCIALKNTPEYGTPKDILIYFTHPVLAGTNNRQVQKKISSIKPKEIITTNTHPYIEERRNPAWKKNSSILRIAYYTKDVIQRCITNGLIPQDAYKYDSLEELKQVASLYDIKRDRNHFLEIK